MNDAMKFLQQYFFGILSLFGTAGHTLLSVIDSAGATLSFFIRGVMAGIVPPYYPRLWLAQMSEIGFYSLPVIGLTTIFSGMVLAIQAIGSLNASLAPVAVPNLVVFAMIKELSPVLVGLMVAGRIGSAISAEIGTMRVSEQIDALHTLNTNVFSYLVFPRLLAAMVMLPLLVLVGDLLGIFGGYIMAVQQLQLPSDVFLNNAWAAITFDGVFGGLIKAFAFGLIVALMGCYHGYHCAGGAEGVGIATTRAVVSSSILILIANFLITIWWYQ